LGGGEGGQGPGKIKPTQIVQLLVVVEKVLTQQYFSKTGEPKTVERCGSVNHKSQMSLVPLKARGRTRTVETCEELATTRLRVRVGPKERKKKTGRPDSKKDGEEKGLPTKP